MGSVVSSVGNAVSGLVGGVGNALGGLGPKYTDTDALQGIANQQVQGAQDAQAQLTGLKDQRSEFGQALANQALGKAPSITEAQLKQAMDRNLSQQIAAAKANRAVNPALQARMVNQQAGQAAQATAQQAAINRLAEQQANQQQFANYLGQQQQAGAQYLSGAGQSQSGVMNTQFANQQRGINMFQGAAQAGMSAAAMMSDRNLKTLIKKYNKGGVVKPKKMADGGKVSASNSIENIVGGAGVPDAFADKDSMQKMGGNLGSILSKLGAPDATMMAGGPMDALGGAGGAEGLMAAAPMMVANKGAVVPGQAKVNGDSEKNDTVPALLSPGEVVVPRTVVAKGSKAVAKFVAQAIKEKQGSTDDVQKKSEGGKVDEFNPQSFLDALKPYSYEYKKDAEGPGVSPGRKLGVMAQDLEKAGPVGRSMVKETQNGKQVDMGAGFGAILAAQAHLNDRLKQLESKYGKK